MKKVIAWGASKLLELYLKGDRTHQVSACIDSFSELPTIGDVPIVKPSTIDFQKEKSSSLFVIFAVSSEAVQSIFKILTKEGLKYGEDFVLYSTFLFSGFKERAEKNFGLTVCDSDAKRFEAFALNSIKPHHTTVLGSVLLDSIVNQLAQDGVIGDIAEVGAFEGGNALALMMLNKLVGQRRYFIMDSYEGFPELSAFDPSTFKAGDHATKTAFEEIENGFRSFSYAKIIKGFVPGTFSQLPENSPFSLVFYDCDLYQPALDTFAFFWDKLSPGGYMVVHDYCTHKGGWEGVEKAVHEFFDVLGMRVVAFPENTMAVIRKNY